jgi:hypothetical protein
MELRAFKQGRLKSGTEQKRNGRPRSVGEIGGEECLLVGRFSRGQGPHEHMSVGALYKMSLYDERSYYNYGRFWLAIFLLILMLI